MKLRAIRGVHTYLVSNGDVGQWLGVLPFRDELE
jgi:hypothetical protein